MSLNEEFQVHETLNPKLFDNSNILIPEVRKKIMQIVNAFETYSDVEMNICDVQLVGSNASYNYTPDSDLDVHIIANFELMSNDTALLKSYFDAAKTAFNKNYDITIKGIDVEIYVQDVKSGIMSNGIYSVCDNTWIKMPKPIRSITKHNTEKEFEKWSKKIKAILRDPDTKSVQDAINMLYLIRHNSIACEGEYGKGNQLFKDIRSAGLLAKLKKELDKQTSKELSLESLRSGKLVTRL